MNLDCAVPIPDVAGSPSHALNSRQLELLVLPFDRHFKTAPSPQALYGSRRPFGWESGQYADFSILTLQKHLGDAGRASEVAVNLERRMVVEQVRQCRILQEKSEMFVALFSVEQACVEVDDPRSAPPCMAAAVMQTPFKSFAGSRE